MANEAGHATVLLEGAGPYEAVLFHRGGVTVDVYYPTRPDEGLHARTTNDLGRSWSEPRVLRDGRGEHIRGRHQSVLRLPSGRLALIHGAPPSPRVHRDYPTLIRYSDDEGQTWSDGRYLHPDPAVMRQGTARVLASGRLLVPVFTWVGPLAGEESEANGRGGCFSWGFFSPAEGGSRRRSESELLG